MPSQKDDHHAVVYLSRRNLQTLISKLDRRLQGDDTQACLVKRDDKHPTYPQSHPVVVVQALEDAEYYTDRESGPVHPDNLPKEH